LLLLHRQLSLPLPLPLPLPLLIFFRSSAHHSQQLAYLLLTQLVL
jgi:hypothetical protein